MAAATTRGGSIHRTADPRPTAAVAAAAARRNPATSAVNRTSLRANRAFWARTVEPATSPPDMTARPRRPVVRHVNSASRPTVATVATVLHTWAAVAAVRPVTMSAASRTG